MTQLEDFLDNWIIHRPDGSAVLNGTSKDFAQSLKEVIALQKIEMLRGLISPEPTEPYKEFENGRWNWWGETEEDDV
tara:strand:+ start:8513 stop:8743 length:231 start_codon:yes stop_codon:yes gene_type:complete